MTTRLAVSADDWPAAAPKPRRRRVLHTILLMACAVLIGTRGAASSHMVSFRAADGTPLAADLYEPSAQPAPGVVLVHMLTRSRLDWASAAERLQEAGIVALAVDLRGHGQSGGSGDPGGDLAPMQRDVQAAVTYLRSRTSVLTGRIGIAGASLGGNLAVLVAAGDPSIRSLALLSAGSDYKGLRIEAALRKVNRPVLLVAGSDDPYALRSAAALAETGPGRETVTLPGAGHGTTMLTRQPDLAGRLVDWFRRTLL
jgi:alpha-beta hydrolase superfamily lysophospholipase